MVRTVLVDDEPHNLENLQWKLQRFCPDVEIVNTFTDPVAAVNFLKQVSVDLVFLDIEMPLMTGFDVLEELGPDVSFDVIFVTAHASFGIKAVKFSALDYILKPVHNRELAEAVEKYKKKSAGPRPPGPDADKSPDPDMPRKPMRIALASKEIIEFVPPEEIMACEADSNYTIVYLTSGGKRVISRTLKDFEEILLPLGFFRPHLSFVINLSHVREFQRGDGGVLVMTDGRQIPVARQKRAQLLQLLGG
jgi:two-component system LytT family response regulator